MKYFVLVTAVLLSACEAMSPRPSDPQMASADYGTSPNNLEEIIKARLSRTLFDPGSLSQFAILSGPEKCGKKCGFGTPVYGWCATYELNAKNRMGGYTGLSKHSVMVINGTVIFEDGLFSENFRCRS